MKNFLQYLREQEDSPQESEGIISSTVSKVKKWFSGNDAQQEPEQEPDQQKEPEKKQPIRPYMGGGGAYMGSGGARMVTSGLAPSTSVTQVPDKINFIKN